MDDQENPRTYYERHLTERHLERFEVQFDKLRDEMKELQKSDFRQHLVLMILVAATLGIDVSKFTLLTNVVRPQQQRIHQLENQVNQTESGAFE